MYCTLTRTKRDVLTRKRNVLKCRYREKVTRSTLFANGSAPNFWFCPITFKKYLQLSMSIRRKTKSSQRSSFTLVGNLLIHIQKQSRSNLAILVCKLLSGIHNRLSDQRSNFTPISPSMVFTPVAAGIYVQYIPYY